MKLRSPIDESLFVGNQWLTPSGPALEVVNPTDETLLASVPTATGADVAEAVLAAWGAKDEWARTPAVQRSAALRAMASLMQSHREQLAVSLMQEVGKPIEQASGELDFAIQYLNYVAEWDRRILGEIIPSDQRGEVINLLRVPFGVVAAICPWNFPLALFARKVAPALLTGNTVVLKPSEVTPLSVLAFVRLIHEHLDLPAGVLNVVVGGGQTGRDLVTDPRVAMVTMTGHRDTGKRIMKAASQNLTRVSLELGGKAPMIVWRDADVELAVQAGLAARHMNAGQACSCAERIYVHDDLVEEFTQRYVEGARALRMGDPATAVDLGPLVNRAQMEKAELAMETARTEGATVVLPGGRPAEKMYEKGYWFAPAVLVDVSDKMTIMREETFAPITPIQSVSSLDEVLRMGNDSRYALSAFLFSNDYGLIMELANQIECGELYVNRPNGEAVQAHHVGHKESGMGGDDGLHGVLKYTQIRTVYHHYGEE